jgi:hypothetical protein
MPYLQLIINLLIFSDYFLPPYAINAYKPIKPCKMNLSYPNEVWKKLRIAYLDKNEKYEISNYGRVRSFKSKPAGSILKNSILKGYEVISVKLIDDKRTTKYIHKLVAEHFIKQDNILQSCVIHIDFDKQNNHLSNLMWVTRETMFAHQKINPHYKRGIISNAKLTETEVIRIKMKLARGKNKLYKIAKEFGITHTQLNRIRSGENWSHVKV